ncbi:glycosyltransferase [Actinophytocola sp.]|uniref:glycosyltransferase n=1 Tax=Actinophytocola sp. TaxID=1872138 RepID=UPI003D6C2B19
MRIAMVSGHASPLGGPDAGGQHVHVAELSKALARQGHDVTVHTRRDTPGQPDEVRTDDGYRVLHLPAGPATHLPEDTTLLTHLGTFARHLHDHWHANPPDIIHSHHWMSGLAALPTAHTTHTPLVHTYHALGIVEKRYQGGDDTSPPQRISTEKLLGHQATHIAATSTDELHELLRMGIPRHHVTVIPCGVDLDHFIPETDLPQAERPESRRTPTGPYPHRLLSVGRLLPRKGFATTIACLRALPHTELLIAGGPATHRLDDNPHARFLRSFAETTGVADQVRLLGRVTRDDLPALLRSADAVVCTPWYTPFGIVPLEAMACGRPVIATAVGGHTDTVVDGITGRLVPPRKPRPLAATLHHLLSHPTIREQYGAAGRDRAAARYSWDRIATETVRLYAQAVAVPAVRSGGLGRNARR